MGPPLPGAGTGVVNCYKPFSVEVEGSLFGLVRLLTLCIVGPSPGSLLLLSLDLLTDTSLFGVRLMTQPLVHETTVGP